MEKRRPTRVKTTFQKFLPKAASPVIFLSPPLSPVGDRRIEATIKLKAIPKGYPGPVVSIVPLEARRKMRNGSFDKREPTSPKVSCMGQINSKKKKKKKENRTKQLVLPSTEKPRPVPAPGKSKKNPFSIKNIFRGSEGCRKTGDMDVKQPSSGIAPSLSQMRLASGRDAFMNFDWMAHGAAFAPDHQNHCSDGQEAEQEKAIVAFTAPIEPKKAIDLWKRRTVPSPPRLQL